MLSVNPCSLAVCRTSSVYNHSNAAQNVSFGFLNELPSNLKVSQAPKRIIAGKPTTKQVIETLLAGGTLLAAIGLAIAAANS